MTFRTLILRSLRFHARAHLGVILGAAVGSAALIGALAVGDSVRGSLQQLAVQRLGKIHYALAPNDRFFRAELATDFGRASTLGGFDKFTGLPELQVGSSMVACLRLPATASVQNGAARANQVQLLGVPNDIWKIGGGPQLTNCAPDAVVLNETLAAQLNVKIGDSIILRIRKPSALSQEAVISPRNEASVALRARVEAIVPASGLANFSLVANQVPPFNAFIPLEVLANVAGLSGRANLLLAGPVLQTTFKIGRLAQLHLKLTALWEGFSHFFGFDPDGAATQPLRDSEARSRLMVSLENYLSLSDLELELRDLDGKVVELRSSRIFLEPPIVHAAHSPLRLPLGASNHIDVLTYLVNQFRAGKRTTPYSMITAVGAPIVPAEMAGDEILINQWLAEDLQVEPGADISLTYFLADSGARLVERTNHFRVRAIVPMSAAYADRTLMPEFPGLAKAESTHDWDAGFPLVHTIRDQDEQYWKKFRGTPKAFVTPAAGQQMWSNRFGNLTAIRFPVPTNVSASEFRSNLDRSLRTHLKPEELGLRFEPVRAEALNAANQAQDFGQLFLGFSFFLILSALILMALLFQFGLEQRLSEVGTLLALGFTPKQVRRLLLWEGTALAFLGGLLGVVGGLGYARLMLMGLRTVWRGAVGTSALGFHLTGPTLLIGLVASVVVSAATIWLVLRKQARRPARELLAEGAEERGWRMENGGWKKSRAGWVGVAAGAAALGMVGWALWKNETADAETFFGAGSLFLIAGLAFSAALFALLGRSAANRRLSVGLLGMRGCARRPRRSLATVGLLACGSFLVMAIGAFKLDANADASKRTSGTGGFALFGQSTLPIIQDLNSKAGQEFFGLDSRALEGMDILPLRVRDGDEASCLNLNRAQTPRLLGANPRLLQTRGAFTFAKLAAGFSAQNPWLHLQHEEDDGAVPAIGDLNSIVWAMGKKVGDSLSLVDEHGQPFKIRLIGGLANSILQGSLLISEEAFVKRFPGESGYRMFLIDIATNRSQTVSSILSRALQDVGLELTPASRRLAGFNAVQNTYLNTFQILGGLGLLLGSAGLGVVVLRNVLERRGELALLQAVGFRRRTLQWLVLSEHGGLLGLGLGVGLVSALVAIVPALLAPGAEVHYLSLVGTLAAVFVSGLAWTWLATRLALRGELLKALRNE